MKVHIVLASVVLGVDIFYKVSCCYYVLELFRLKVILLWFQPINYLPMYRTYLIRYYMANTYQMFDIPTLAK